jgi:hypothetical protein
MRFSVSSSSIFGTTPVVHSVQVRSMAALVGLDIFCRFGSGSDSTSASDFGSSVSPVTWPSLRSGNGVLLARGS